VDERRRNLTLAGAGIAAIAKGPHPQGRVGRKKRKTPATGTGTTGSSLRIGDVRSAGATAPAEQREE